MIRLLYTTDLHGAILPQSYVDGGARPIGLAALAKQINERRDEKTILIDGGDAIQGSPLAFYHQLKRGGETSPVTRAMRILGYDFINLGNHDFSFGREALDRYLSETGAVCLTANVCRDGRPLAPPFLLREIGDCRLAFVGATTHVVPRWEREETLRGLTFTDAFESLRQQVALAKEARPDWIIAVYHGGFETNPENGEAIDPESDENQGSRILEEIPEIDILLAGHQHRLFCGTRYRQDGNRTLYLQTDNNGRRFAEVRIDPATRAVETELIENAGVAAPELAAAVSEEEVNCQTWLDEPLGEAVCDLSVRDEAEARRYKAAFVTFLNRVQAEATGAELSGTALFAGATGFSGQITMRELIASYTFANTLVVKRVSGAVLREYLETSAKYWALEDGELCVNPSFLDPPMHFNYDMVDGVEYTIDASRPAGERIISLTRKGRPVADEDVFTLAVNNYRAAGGGGYPMLAAAETIREEQTDIVELLAAYILKHKRIEIEPVHNIKVLPEAAEGRKK